MSITVGVIGCGNIARFHFDGLAKAGAKIAWVCDLDETAARPYVERFGARFTKRSAEIFADPAVQAVDITTISRAHKLLCLGAIAANKAVICEKTLAENADDALEIVRASEGAGTVFYTSYMKRFVPAVEKAHELLPGLGQILATHIRAYQCWGNLFQPNPNPQNGISEVRRKYGGGILVCGGSHILDLILYLVGRPHRLYATIVQPADRDIDLHASALLETDHGIVHYDALAHPHTRAGFLRDGWDERVEIIGTNGRLEILSAAWDTFDSKVSVLQHYDNAGGTETEYRFAPVSPFNRALSFFCENIAAGTQGAQSRYTGYEVDELIATILRSAERKEALPVVYRVG